LKIELIKPDRASGKLKRTTVTSLRELHRLISEDDVTYLLVLKVGNRLQLLRGDEVSKLEDGQEVYAIPPSGGG